MDSFKDESGYVKVPIDLFNKLMKAYQEQKSEQKSEDPRLAKIKNEPIFYQACDYILGKQYGGSSYANEFVDILVELYEKHSRMSQWQRDYPYATLLGNINQALKYPHTYSLRGCHDDAIRLWRDIK